MICNLTSRSKGVSKTPVVSRRVASIHKSPHLKREISNVFNDPESSLPLPRISYEKSIRNLNFWLPSKIKARPDKPFEEVEQSSICVLPSSVKYQKTTFANNLNTTKSRSIRLENLPSMVLASNYSSTKPPVNDQRKLNPYFIKENFEAKPANDFCQAKFNDLLVSTMVANKVADKIIDLRDRNASENLKLSIKKETEKLVNNFEHLNKTIKLKGTNYEKIENQVHEELSKKQKYIRNHPQLEFFATKVNNFFLSKKNSFTKEGLSSLDACVKQIFELKKASKQSNEDIKLQTIEVKELEIQWGKRIEVIVL
jgi:hypothetical protein